MAHAARETMSGAVPATASGASGEARGDMLTLLSEAEMIGADVPRGVAPELVRRYSLVEDAATVRTAHLVATAHGVYEARLNGVSVDDAVLNPGWTSYEWRLLVQVSDVTLLVREGGRDQELALTLGNGWWRGALGFDALGVDYGDELGCIAVLEIVYEGGARQTVPTALDGAWRAYETQVRENSLYNGETTDARVVRRSRALAVAARPLDRTTLALQEMPPVRRHEVLCPQRIWTSPAGRTLVDFGQNITGWVRVRASGPAGTEVVLRHAEVLEHGELGTRPLRAAEATDTFILSGSDDVLEPTFTFHGFRYVEVSGWPGELTADALEAVAIGSDLARTGWFSCSNDEVNQLVRNTLWSQMDNFVSIPTDCPQRDERMGWTGDIAVFAPTAAFQFDCRAFLDSWLRDLVLETEHRADRAVPVVIPDIVKYGDHLWNQVGELAVWADATVWVPKALWRAYGDREALARHYPAMCLHLAKAEGLLSPEGLWNAEMQLGDWLDPAAPPEAPMEGKTDKYLIAQAALCRSARFAAEAAGLLDKAEDEARWRSLADRSLTAFRKAYVLPGGRMTSDSVCAYALALSFGLLEEGDRASAAARLAELVRVDGYHISTGFVGTPYVTWALSEHGFVEDAYRLLLQRDCPSWLYPVSMGATTTWERWDSMLPDGSINPGGMTSFNHYALGAVCDWIYQVVGGIRPAAPGYARVRIEPVPGGGITWAQCAYDSVRGRIEVGWRIAEDGMFGLTCTVPADVTAEVVLPNGERYEVDGGTRRFGCAGRP